MNECAYHFKETAFIANSRFQGTIRIFKNLNSKLTDLDNFPILKDFSDEIGGVFF